MLEGDLGLVALGGLAEAALLSLASPEALGGKRHSRWKVFGTALLVAVLFVLVGLVGRRGRPLVTDAPSAMLAFVGGLGLGLGAVLRAYGRLPVLDEVGIAATTGVFWYGVAFFALRSPLLAVPVGLVGAAATFLVLRDALRREAMVPASKKRAYLWVVLVGVWLGAASFVDPGGGILFAGFEADAPGLFLLGMALTYLAAQATLAFLLFLRERGAAKEHVDAGYVPERDLLPRLVDDRQASPALLAAVLAAVPALLLANHAAGLLSPASAVSVVLVAVPFVALARRRAPATTA